MDNLNILILITKLELQVGAYCIAYYLLVNSICFLLIFVVTITRGIIKNNELK